MPPILPLLLLFAIVAAAARRPAQAVTNTAPPRISSPYGPRGGRIHQGVDMPAPRGTPVRAAADGRIVAVSPDGARQNYGNTVIILHDSGVATLYAHLESFDSRNAWVGQRVSAGDQIGRVGTTQKPLPPGDHPHLHFEVLRELVTDAHGNPIVNAQTPARIDPEQWLRAA